MSGLLDKIRSKGYWRVVVRPNHFAEKRVEDISALKPILQKSSVRLRGWDFPHINGRGKSYRDVDSIVQEFEWDHYHELWRLFQSGQFIYYGGFVMDWTERKAVPSSGGTPKKVLSVRDAVFRFTEIFEFAARMALTEAGHEQMHIEIKAGGLKGRFLWVDPARYIDFSIEQKAEIDEVLYQADVPSAKLMGQPKELALFPARELFKRFDWDANLEVLRDMQATLRS